MSKLKRAQKALNAKQNEGERIDDGHGESAEEDEEEPTPAELAFEDSQAKAKVVKDTWEQLQKAVFELTNCAIRVKECPKNV